MKTIISLLTLLPTITLADFSQTHTYTPQEGKWLYVRASEASTLFISDYNKGKEVHFEMSEATFTETHKTHTRILDIKSVARDNLDYIIHYNDNAENVERTVIYPFRDIDNTWVVIHYKSEGENEMYFTTPLKYKHKIPYLNE